jgi:hypothetical protein
MVATLAQAPGGALVSHVLRMWDLSSVCLPAHTCVNQHHGSDGMTRFLSGPTLHQPTFVSGVTVMGSCAARLPRPVLRPSPLPIGCHLPPALAAALTMLTR